MPIVSTPGQQPIPYTQPATVPSTAPVLDDNPIADTAAFTPSPLSQPPSSRLQNVMSTPSQQPQQSTVAPMFPPMPTQDNDGFLSSDEDEFGDDESDDFSPLPQPSLGAMPTGPQKQQLSLSRMTEEQRRKAIADAFSLVLGKEPIDRDYSYYRFSTLTEDGLIKSLLSLPEHKQMVDKAKEHTSLKQGVSDLDLRVKQLDTNLHSMQQELITLQSLLVEKNRYIQQMRGIPVENQSMPPAMPTTTQQPVRDFIPPVTGIPQPASQPIPAQQTPKPMPEIQTTTLPGPFDEMKSMLGALFGKRN